MEIIKRLSRYRNFILSIVDIFCIAIAYYLGTVLITDSVFNFNAYYVKRLFITTITSAVVYQVIFRITKIYHHIIRYEEGRDYVCYIIFCLISSILVSILDAIFHLGTASTKLNILAGIFIGLMMVSYRIIIRYILVADIVNKGIPTINETERKNLLIIGAGNAAHEIIKTINANLKEKYNIVGIIDDNKKRLNLVVAGVKIIGNRNDIIKICEKQNVDVIFFSIARIDNKNKKEILNICQQTKAKVRILPGMKEIIKGKNLLDNLRDVEIEDILGRDTIALDNHNIENLIKNKTILVTGSGGSIGSELVRQIAKYCPKQIIIVDIYENNAYEIQQELIMEYGDSLNLITLIASVRDYYRMNQIFERYKPDVVFHAAAHKHVKFRSH